MSWLDGVRHRLHTLVRPGAYARELDEEMAHHLELDAMQQGSEARAKRRFGSRAFHKEETRRMTWLASFDVLRQDLSYAWRSLARSPGHTALVVATLALGIGVNASVFVVLDRLYVRPPAGVAHPEELRRFWITHYTSREAPETWEGMSHPQYRALVGAAADPSSLTLYTTDWSERLGHAGDAPKVRAVYATASYFRVLGVRPALGRFFVPDEDVIGRPTPVAVISHRFWRRVFGGDTTVLGRTIALGRREYTVIGVAARGFGGLDLQEADVWIPLAAQPPATWWPADRGSWFENPNTVAYLAIQRVRAEATDASFEQRATAAIRAVNLRLARRNPDTLATVARGPIIAALGPGKPGAELVISTRLAAVALIVLVIAFANTTNLLLARANRRRREIAVRIALGISRWRLARLLLTETVLLAFVAAVVALLAAAWGGSLLRSLLFPEIEWYRSTIDVRIAWFALGVALSAGLLSGIVIAIQVSRPDLTIALKTGEREGGSARSALRAGLVAAQAALSVALLVGALLFVVSLRNVESLDIGFNRQELLVAHVSFAEGEDPSDEVFDQGLQRVAARFEDRPGVKGVARASLPPMRGFAFTTFYVGADSSDSFGKVMPSYTAVSPSFFRTAGLEVRRGRGFSDSVSAQASHEMLVNETMAKLVWRGADPIGQCVRFRDRESSCFRVVGIVEDARRFNVIEDTPAPQYYVPLGIAELGSGFAGTLLVRADRGTQRAVTRELATALRAEFPSATPDIELMTDVLEPEYRPWRLGATLFSGLGMLALLVAAIGIYSNVWYAVAQRTREFGIRMALGARIADVLRLVVGQSLRVVVIGIAGGLLLVLLGGGLIASLLFGIGPRDPRTMLVVSGSLLAVSVLAAFFPAWRAARVDPTIALRAD